MDHNQDSQTWESRMISLHNGTSIPASVLLERGAIMKRIGKTDMYSVEFPARNGVGPISATWRAEPNEIIDCVSDKK